MDILPTQALEDYDFTPTQRLSHSSQRDTTEEDVQVGVLHIGPNRYPIKNGITKIGRHPACNIALKEQTVSKQHAEIEASSHDTSAWICDLNSSNKTKLNNLTLRPNRCYELKDGSVIEFGSVCATYKICQRIDDSMIPETPAAICRSTKQLFIPGTPDSSMNNSSASMENMSMIPATQANNSCEFVFRRPSLPQRSSTSHVKTHFIQDSSSDDSMNDSRNASVQEKQNVGKDGVSIHDMETQNSFESPGETDGDIHDIETQKICMSSIKALAKSNKAIGGQYDIHDIETQDDVTDIHDIETQHDIDIHDMKTPRKITSRNTDSSIQDTEQVDLEETQLTNESKSKERISRCEDVIDKNKLVEADKSIKGEDCIANTERSYVQKGSQEYLQLSLTTNFEDNCSEVDADSRLLGSPNLLEDLIEVDEPLEDSKSRLSTSKTSRPEQNDTTEKSTDDENIFDVATQVKDNKQANIFEAATQRVRSTFTNSNTEDDSDDTDIEDALLRYSRDEEKINEKTPKDQLSGSEDSDTDEEGHFKEIALKEKQVASKSSDSLEIKNTENKEDETSSRDSDDLFDTQTQHINPENVASSTKEIENNEDDVDFDTATQIIQTADSRNSFLTKKNVDIEYVDNMDLTQLLPTTGTSAKANDPPTNTKDESRIEELEDITEMEDDIATQILSAPEKDNDQVNASSVEKCSVEDIDYEMAPTQLISDVECSKPRSSTIISMSKQFKKSTEVNLNDTLERNLNEMFDDVNEDIGDQSQISTQVLKNVLQLSHCNDKVTPDNDNLNTNDESITVSKVQKSKSGRKSEVAVVEPIKLSVEDAKSNLKNINAENDSQTAENYFSKLTSTRKQNVLVDSQDIPESINNVSSDKSEEATVKSKTINVVSNMNNRVSEASPKFAPENASTPRLTKIVEMNATSPKEKLSKANVNAFEKTEETDNHVNEILVDTKQTQQLPTNVDNDDEDILANFPEVKISGTVSNPGSPTSSTSTIFKLIYNNKRAKERQQKAEAKTTRGSRKSSRKTQAQESKEFIEHSRTFRRPTSSRLLMSLSVTSSNNDDADKTTDTVQESNDKKSNKKSKQTGKKTSARSSRKSNVTMKDSSSQQKLIFAIDSQEPARQSSPILSNGRTRRSRQENVDHSSIFQVEKEGATVNTADIPTKKTIFNVSRLEKRSLNASDALDERLSKKRKEDTVEDTAVTAKDKKIVTRKSTIASRRHSANILDCVTKRNSPLNRKNSDDSSEPPRASSEQKLSINKQIVIKIVRMTPDIQVEPSKNTISKITNQSLESVDDSSDANKSIPAENEKPVQNRRKKKVANRKTIIPQPKAQEISSEIGEESQEIEMIMRNALHKEQDVSLETEKTKATNNSTKGTRQRNSTKRINTSAPTDVDTTENNILSESSESKLEQLQVLSLRAKRTRVSKDTSIDTANTSTNKPILRARKRGRQSKSLRSSQQLSNLSLVHENEEPANTISNKTSKAKEKKSTTKLPTAEKRNENVTDESISSEMNSSIDNVSTLSTPSRTRRSMSSSFSLSSPLGPKHKVLFTGIPIQNYGTLLKKLGASQADDPTKCTVLVTDKIRRTVKFLCALAQSVPIVSIDWLTNSQKAGRLLDLDGYILKDRSAEDKFGFSLESSLRKAREHKLLEGYTIVLTPNISAPPISELKSIVASCGGKCLTRPPTSWPQKSIIISATEDLANATKFATRLPKTGTIQSTEFLLTGILKQELDFIKYKLK